MHRKGCNLQKWFAFSLCSWKEDRNSKKYINCIIFQFGPKCQQIQTPNFKYMKFILLALRTSAVSFSPNTHNIHAGVVIQMSLCCFFTLFPNQQASNSLSTQATPISPNGEEHVRQLEYQVPMQEEMVYVFRFTAHRCIIYCIGQFLFSGGLLV